MDEASQQHEAVKSFSFLRTQRAASVPRRISIQRAIAMPHADATVDMSQNLDALMDFKAFAAIIEISETMDAVAVFQAYIANRANDTGNIIRAKL